MLRPALWLALLLLVTPLHAGVRLSVRGVDEPLQQAVSSAVELSQYAKRELSAAQFQRLYASAPAQARTALEPYGYYDAHIDAQQQSDGNDWQVTLTVQLGEPVTISTVDVQLDADAQALPAIRHARNVLLHLRGQRLVDTDYDAARDALSSALAAYGFLDAKLVTHRVEVNATQHRADIHLVWQTGPRYRYGKVQFDGAPFRPGFLDRYLPFQPDDPYDQNQLLQLQQALTATGYFAMASVEPQRDSRADGHVDIAVQLRPAKRTVYTGGPFIGTDTGAGLRGGIEKRWVNTRGASWNNELVLAQRLKTLSTLYAIPMPGTDQRSYNLGANYRDANTATSQSRTLELVGNATRQWHGWTRSFGLHLLSGTFTVGKRGNEPDSTPGIEHGNSTLLFGEATLTRKQADNLDFVHQGWSLAFTARSTVGTALSSASFHQLGADAKWIHAFGARNRNRLILRGSTGHLWTSDFAALPPQLRYFAGGDRSVRGYSYQSIGPENAAGRVIGGSNLLLASAEVEHYLTPRWGIASFVDAGNAFDNIDYRPKLGAGIGLRWRSPVGMIRLDIGKPIHDAQRHGVMLHLVIGPDL